MFFIEASVILAQDFLEVATHVVHHDKDALHIFGDDQVKDFDRVNVFLHLSQMPQDLYFPQHFLEDVIFSIFETSLYILDSDQVLGGSVLGANNHAASTLSNNSLNLIFVFYEVPFFGQSLMGLDVGACGILGNFGLLVLHFFK